MSLSPEQRQELVRLLEKGEELSPEWARILFPPEKREYELVYQGKDREEDIIADTLAVPLQAVRTFGRNGVDWRNMLIFGDNLQAMKTLVQASARRTVRHKPSPLRGLMSAMEPLYLQETEETLPAQKAPFEAAKAGDLVKPI